MTFHKTAAVTTIGVVTSDGNTFIKTADYDENNSSYLSGKRSIDISSTLKSIANEYDISANPADYIFEAIRGNTANVPNDNKDGFHKSELLRFDHRLAKQVYRTYENKPHHVNHRADNPKNARGFIVDVHYNDLTPPLEICPNPRCNNKTAEKSNRDPETGIHCNKCGTVVKDEFVELLVAIDTKKDPTFADGIKRGILKHGSMGCSCLRTRCNVCDKVAYSRSEFCSHVINKGREYDENEPGFNPIAFVVKYSEDGKLIKVAFACEWCEGVIFDEFSRVHDPADTKAEQYEILQLTAKAAQLEKDDKLRNESEILTLQTRVSELERIIKDKMSKTAQVAPPTPPPAVAPTPAPAPAGMPPPMPGMGGPEMGMGGPEIDEDVEEEKAPITVNINVGSEGVEVETNEPVSEIPASATPIEKLTPEEAGATPAGEGETLTPAGVGILPGGRVPPREGSVRTRNNGESPMLRFADSYKHLKAEITKVGNIRIFDDNGTIFVVKPDRINDSKIASKVNEDLAKSVLIMIAQHGLGGAIKRTNAIVGTRLAQVLEYHINDMKGVDREQTNSILDMQDDDAADERGKDKKTETVTGIGSDSDRKEEYKVKDTSDDVLVDRDVDIEDEQHDRDADSLSATEMHDSDMRSKRKDWDQGKSSIDDVSVDHKERVARIDLKKHAARIETIYQKRLNRKIAELEKQQKDFQQSFMNKLARAMKIAAHRQSLNVEYSPLKTAMGITLCNERNLDDGFVFEPMDQKLAIDLVEAAFNEPIIGETKVPAWESQIDNLINRTASIMEMSDEALMQIEADLKNMRHIMLSVDSSSETKYADSNLRQAAKQGNMQLKPAVESNIDSGGFSNRRNTIRGAMRSTRVASLAANRV